MKIYVKIILLFGVVVFIIFFLGYSFLSKEISKDFANSEPFAVTVNHLKTDSHIHNNFGKIVAIDSSISGKLEYDKSARFVFDVETESEDITITSELIFEDNEWKITNMFYE